MTQKSPLQITTQTSGSPSKNITLSADTPEEMSALVADLVKVADDIVEGLTTLDQVLIAKGVMAGTTASSGAVAAGPASTGLATPPPTGAQPTCPEHGAMKDMAGKYGKSGQPYKNRWYCSKYGCDATKPQGEWVP